MKSPLYMKTKELLDEFGVVEDGVRKVPSKVIQQLLANPDGPIVTSIEIGELIATPSQPVRNWVTLDLNFDDL